jgi:hypothetical protein
VSRFALRGPDGAYAQFDEDDDLWLDDGFDPLFLDVPEQEALRDVLCARLGPPAGYVSVDKLSKEGL